MTVGLFITLLFGFSVLSGLVTQAIKQFVKDKDNISYNIIALVVALIVGTGGTFIYYQLSGIVITTNNIIFAVLMGLGSGLSSMVGFDKVKQTVQQLTGTNVEIPDNNINDDK